MSDTDSNTDPDSDETAHDVRPVVPDGPQREYVICATCGRTANTPTDLARRPCSDADSEAG